jgi:hypothetical protein
MSRRHPAANDVSSFGQNLPRASGSSPVESLSIPELSITSILKYGGSTGSGKRKHCHSKHIIDVFARRQMADEKTVTEPAHCCSYYRGRRSRLRSALPKYTRRSTQSDLRVRDFELEQCLNSGPWTDYVIGRPSTCAHPQDNLRQGSISSLNKSTRCRFPTLLRFSHVTYTVPRACFSSRSNSRCWSPIQ